MSHNVYTSESPIAGKGVFAKKVFKKGEIVFILKGKVTHWEVIDAASSAAGPNWIGIKKGVWIDPAYPYMYLNHSCDPNIGIKGSVVFHALRDIKKGEEVMFDYSITEDDVLWHLPHTCACGSRKCRGDIRSIQFLPPSVFKSYLPYIPNYFRGVYTKLHKGTLDEQEK